MSEQIRPAVAPAIDDQILPDVIVGSGGSVVGGAPAGYPDIADAATSQTTSNNTSHTVNLPTGIVSGQLLLLIGALDGTPTISATGWTSVTTASNTVAVEALYRIADGSEGSTVTVTSTASEKAEFYVARITAAHGSAAPEGSSTATGTASANVEMPSLTPTWGAANNLWFAIGVWDLSSDASLVAQTQPVRYSYAWERTTAATDGVGLIIAVHWLNAASQDPAEFELPAGEQFSAAMVAVRPV